jgi:protein SCO1/2
MAGRTMNKASFRAALASLLIAAASLGGCGGASERPPLADARIGGPFTLTDQDGHRVSDRDFAGKYRLIYFGYTYCPDVCPVDVQTLMKGYRELEKTRPKLAARIQPIFITVDPARDTPAVLKQFVRAFHPKLIGLTGSEAEIAAVAKEYAIYYKKQETPAGASGYLMDHSRQAMLFGPEGQPLALITQDKGADAVVADIERWAR